MEKTIKYLLLFLVLGGIVIAQNFQYLYNPYTGRQDRSLSLNQTGYTIIADGFTLNDSTSVDTDTHVAGSGYLYNDSTTMYLNESMLNDTIDARAPTSTTYYLNSSAVTGGSYTDGSDVTSAWYYGDDLKLNFTEGGGADPLDIYLNFTNVNDIDQLVMREYYLGSSSHFIQVQIWDYADSAWEDYFEFPGQSGFTIISIPVFDATDHIDSGNVQVRLHHVQNGITSHRLYIDFVWLVEGNNIGGSTNLDGYAKYSFGYNDFSGNGDFTTTGTITAGCGNFSGLLVGSCG